MTKRPAPAPAPRTVERGERRIRPLSESVLRLIWDERRISRSDIARRADLSRSTVSDVVGSLLPTGLVEECGTGPSRGGRKPIVLEFRDDAFGILGVEVGATHVAVAVTDLRGRVLAWNERDHDVRNDPSGTLRTVCELCERGLAQWGHGSEQLVGIGVALPAPVDPRHPESISVNVMPRWEGRNALVGLGAQFDVPVMFDNDANLGALAEHWWGIGRGIDDFAYIKVATGVGSGHLIQGRVYRGATGIAGEIGHLAIDPAGERCVCGLRGCLTTFVGRTALLGRMRALAGPQHPLGSPEANMRTLEDAALRGDAVARQVVGEAAEHLATAVSGLLNLMNPGMIVLGGDLARLGDLLLEPLRAHVHARTLISSVAAAEIKTSELGPRSVAVGAATMVLDAALEDSRLFPLSDVVAQKKAL